MIFFAIFSITLLLSICTSLLLIKVLSPVINSTINKMFVYEMQHVWRKYVQIALFIIGTSSGVNVYNLQKFFQETNKKFSIELLISESWESIRSCAISIILSMLVLFFVYLIVSYLNQLAPQHPKEETPKQIEDNNALENKQVDEKL